MNGDQPLRIIKAKTKGKDIFFTVEWKPRPTNQKVPEVSDVSNVELKQQFPGFLADFYESKMTFIPANV